MELSVIVPAYKKTNCILEAISAIDKSLNGISHEIIVVDDGSPDNTLKQALKTKVKCTTVLGYEKNKGKGNALKYGAYFAKGNFVAFADADLDLNPDKIPLFMKIMKDKKADIVIGSKRHPLSEVDYPLSRRIMSDIYYYLFARLLFGLDVKDTQVGMKLFKRKALYRILERNLCKRYAFDLELLVIAKHLGYKTIEAPIELKYKFSGSGINLKSVWNMLVDTLAILYRLRILKYYDKARE